MITNYRVVTVFAALLGLIVLGTRISFAAPAFDRIIASGDTIENDLNINEDLDVEVGSVINANVNIFGGDAKIAGTINGNLVVFGGDVELLESAVLHGECVVIAGEVVMTNHESVCTAVGQELDVPLPNLVLPNVPLPNAPVPPVPMFDSAETSTTVHSSGPTFFSALFTSIFLGVLALGTTMLAPRHVERISDAVTVRPVAVGTVGVLTFIASVFAIAILAMLSALLTIVCVGLLGMPIVLAMSALLFAGGLIGWVSIGKIVGDVLRDVLHMHQISVPMTAALGTTALSLAIGLIGLLPAIGFGANIAIFLVGGIGLGATALTRFGTRNWPLFVISEEKVQTVADSLDDEITFL